MGIFWLETPFSGVGGNGGFSTPKPYPLFPILGFLTPVQGGRIRKESLNGGLSKSGLKVLVHNCPRLPTIVDSEVGKKVQGKRKAWFRTYSLTSFEIPPETYFWPTSQGKHHPAPVRNFSLLKKWGPQRKDFGGRYGCPGFYRVFVSTTGLEKFVFEARKVFRMFSFGGGSVVFFFSASGLSWDQYFFYIAVIIIITLKTLSSLVRKLRPSPLISKVFVLISEEKARNPH